MASEYVDLEGMLERRYASDNGEWIVLRELSNGTGSKYTGRIDVAALNAWASKKHIRLAFEIKRSRSDFKREIENPDKRAWAEEQFHQTWFMTTPGVCEVEELPEKWGLIVSTKNGKKLVTKRIAAWRDAPKWDPLAIAAVRHCAKRVQSMEAAKLFKDGGEITEEAINAIVEERVKARRELLERERKMVMDERNMLMAERDTLHAPLRALIEASGQYCFPRATLTSTNVKELLERAVTRRVEAILQHAVNARDSLSMLVDAANREQLGEPDGAQKTGVT